MTENLQNGNNSVEKTLREASKDSRTRSNVPDIKSVRAEQRGLFTEGFD